MKFLNKEINKSPLFGLNGSDTINSLQNEALNEFNKQGLPNKNWEEWKYSDFSSLNKMSFAFGVRKNISSLPDSFPEINDTNQIVFLNGYFQNKLSNVSSKISVKTIEEAYKSDSELIHNLLSPNSNPFHNINSAMINSGLMIIVNDNEIINDPIHIINYTTDLDEPLMNHPLFIIKLGNGSEASIIDHYYGSTNIEYWQNSVTKIKLSKNSSLNHFRLQEESASSIHIADTNYIVEKDAQLNAFHLATGASKYRQNINVNLNDIGASSTINGLCLTKDNQHHDHFITINHLKEKCSSKQLFKYILSDSSLGIFNGKVIVKKGAQQTDAKQSTKNLILNDSAVAHSNPQLEIYADEVKCSHGSTTGQLDQDAIFYMRSRGIDYKTAQLILINGFAKEVLKIISEKNVNQYINKQLSFWLENAGIT